MSYQRKAADIENRVYLEAKRAGDKKQRVFIYTLVGCTASAFVVAIYAATIQRMAPDTPAHYSAAMRETMTQFISSMFGF